MPPSLPRRPVLAGGLLLPWLSRLPVRASARSVSAESAGRPAPLLPSWRPGPARDRILTFLRAVTTEGSDAFVPLAERIAVFDNDGTLWSEQPMYVQLAFALDRARALGLAVDRNRLLEQGHAGLLDLLARTHTGMDSDAFTELVRRWFTEARHPTLRLPYTALAYQPMLELLDAFRGAGFRTWIVTGGGLEFVRVVSERLYGIPPEQVVGSSIVHRFVDPGHDDPGGQPRLVREPKLEFIDDGPGKPVGIQRAIGRRPVAAFGNSDGDLEMLRWTTAGPGARLGMLLHHDDAAREVAYDRTSPVGRLDRGLEQAERRGWGLISMRRDWSQVFAGSEARSMAASAAV